MNFCEKKGRSLVTPSISFSRPIVAGVFGMVWNRLECQHFVMYIIYFYLLLLKSLNYATKRETLIDTKKDISIIYSYTVNEYI